MTAARALFFSHDRRGLGHLRRTLALCDALLRRPDSVATLLVTGSRMAHAFRMPAELDYVKLPSVQKLHNDEYAGATLDVPVDQIFRIREEILFQTTRLFQPDLLFLDTPPLAATGEVVRTVLYVRKHMKKTQIVVNLRDILDEGQRVCAKWRQHGIFEFLENCVDRILIYGSHDVYDAVSEYEFPSGMRDKTVYCGYIARGHDKRAAELIRERFCTSGRKLVVVTVGGGSDGASLIEQYLQAASQRADFSEISSVILLGSDLCRDDLARIRKRHRSSHNTVLLDFVESATSYIAAADLVVSMAGYNTLSEIAYLRKSAIVVPRVRPAAEQLVRARRFAELGIVRMLHPDEARPQLLAESVNLALHHSLPHAANRIDFGGSEAFVREVDSLLDARPISRN